MDALHLSEVILHSSELGGKSEPTPSFVADIAYRPRRSRPGPPPCIPRGNDGSSESTLERCNMATVPLQSFGVGSVHAKSDVTSDADLVAGATLAEWKIWSVTR